MTVASDNYKPGDHFTTTVEGFIRYPSKVENSADVTLILANSVGCKSEFQLGSYRLDDCKPLTPPVKVGDVVSGAIAIAALPFKTIVRGNGSHIGYTKHAGDKWSGGGDASFRLAGDVTVLYLP